MKTKTSISDYNDYKLFCEKAATDEKTFDSFKQNSVYTEILEHCSYEQGNLFIQEIIKNNNLDLYYLEKLKENDLYGSSNKLSYESPFGLISPSTLRYIKVLSDLIKHFGDLNSMSIVEIGVGYGGQSKIIMDYFKIKEYNYIDLREVNLLAKTYLSKFNYENLHFLDFENLPDKKYDLIISNYAITECEKTIQEYYIEKIIKNSKNGYMIGNNISHIFDVQSKNIDEWKSSIPNLKIYEEVPKTGADNYLMVF